MEQELRNTALRNRGYYRGVFRPVQEEVSSEVTYRGILPKDLVGEYVHVGPCPSALPKEPGSFLYHSFDGDGMMHGVTFRDGRAFYANRWVQTQKLAAVRAKGGVEEVYSLGQALAGRMRMEVDMDFRSGEVMGRANTNVVTHAGNLYALHEADKPYRVQASLDPERNLRTIERATFGQKLRHPMTAHPRVDPASGHLICFGINPVESPARVHYSVIDANSEVCHHMTIPLPRAVMMHDMAITPNFSILFDFNFAFRMRDLFEGKSPWSHVANEPARFAIFPRFAKDEGEVKWFEIPACCVFHIPGAWEEDTPEGKVVVLLGNRSPSPTISDVAGKAPAEYLTEWRFNLDTGSVVSERQISNTYMAFPVIDPRRDGRPFRYVYGSLVADRERALEEGWLDAEQDSFPVFDGVGKIDVQTGEVRTARLTTFAGNPGLVCEVAFARRTGSTSDAEDDGYLVTYLNDPVDGTTECIVLDARDLSVVARMGLPGRVPAGFHSEWIRAEALR